MMIDCEIKERDGEKEYEDREECVLGNFLASRLNFWLYDLYEKEAAERLPFLSRNVPPTFRSGKFSPR